NRLVVFDKLATSGLIFAQESSYAFPPSLLQRIGRCLPREMQQILAHPQPGSSLRTFRLEGHLTTESSIRWGYFQSSRLMKNEKHPHCRASEAPKWQSGSARYATVRSGAACLAAGKRHFHGRLC